MSINVKRILLVIAGTIAIMGFRILIPPSMIKIVLTDSNWPVAIGVLSALIHFFHVTFVKKIFSKPFDYSDAKDLLEIVIQPGGFYSALILCRAGIHDKFYAGNNYPNFSETIKDVIIVFSFLLLVFFSQQLVLVCKEYFFGPKMNAITPVSDSSEQVNSE